MRSRVTLKTQSATVNDSGEAVYAYSAAAGNTDIAAAVKNISRRITTNSDVSQPLGEETYEIRVRYRAGLNIGDQVHLQTTGAPGYVPPFVVIRGMENVGEINHELVLTCEVADV